MRGWAIEYLDQVYINNNLTAIISPTTPMTAPELTEAARSHGQLALFQDPPCAHTLLLIPVVLLIYSFFSSDLIGESDAAKLIRLMKYIFLANLVGRPGITVPVGFDEATLPIGFHFMGR